MPDIPGGPDDSMIPPDDLLQQLRSEETPLETETVDAEADTTGGEPETTETRKLPEHVPYDRFQEVWDRMRQAEQENQYFRTLAMQAAHNQVNSGKKPENKDEVDPELMEIIAPVVKKMVAPIMQGYQDLQDKAQSDAAWNKVVKNVPDLDELQPHMIAYINGLDHSVAADIVGNPDLMIQTANFIRLRNQAGNTGAQAKAKADLKQRSRGEAPGGTRITPNSLENTFREASEDPAKLQALMVKMGFYK